MFALEHHIRVGVFAQFRQDQHGAILSHIGNARTPTIFHEEHIAHEARSDFHLDKEFNIVKLAIER